MNNHIELKHSHNKKMLECGVDEVGRGCLCGPVVAGAVILPNEIPDDFSSKELSLIRDSKKLSERQRYRARDIINAIALNTSIGFIDNVIIDKVNIRNASIKAMHKALDGLILIPEFILVDGDYFQTYRRSSKPVVLSDPTIIINSGCCNSIDDDDNNDIIIKHETFEKGDSQYMSIAAASIIAKIARDEFMIEQHKLYPNYSWDTNKGYGTKAHYNSLELYGITPLHRRTFRLNNDIYKKKS